MLATIEVLFAFAGYDLQLYLVKIFEEGVNAWWGIPLLVIYFVERLMLLFMTVWIIFSSFGDNEDDWMEVPSLLITFGGAFGTGLLFAASIRTEMSLAGGAFEEISFLFIYLIVFVVISFFGLAQASRFS